MKATSPVHGNAAWCSVFYSRDWFLHQHLPLNWTAHLSPGVAQGGHRLPSPQGRSSALVSDYSLNLWLLPFRQS